MDFDYKKYSLGELKTWVSDALLSSEATPQEIYDVIKGVVEEEYHYFKHHTGRCYDLLALLNGNSKHITNKYEEKLNSFFEKPTVEDIMPPWGHSDMEALRYSEEELNAMCDKAASDQEKEKCHEYNLREAEYYDKRVQIDAEIEAIKAAGGYEWTPSSQKSQYNGYDHNDVNRQNLFTIPDYTEL